MGETGPVAFGDVAGLELARVDTRLGREQPLRELHAPHLHREEEDRPARGDGDARGGAEGECGLAGAGARGHDHEVGALEPEQDLVELVVAGGRAGDLAVAAVEGLEMVEGALERVADADHRLGDPALRHLEHERLRPVEGVDDVVGHLVAHLGDVAGDADQAAEQRQLADDLGVMARVGRGRRVGLDLQQGARGERLASGGGAPRVASGGGAPRAVGKEASHVSR